MKVLVDTCVWSLALRRRKKLDLQLIQGLSDLIKELRVQMIGPIRQELLSGIRSTTQFEKLKLNLQAFPDLPLESEDYESAAEFFNICYKKGIQGSNTDFLICALSFRHQMPIFTIDKDFQHFKKYLPISIYKIKK
jgi:hypothetical protein